MLDEDVKYSITIFVRKPTGANLCSILIMEALKSRESRKQPVHIMEENHNEMKLLN